MPFIKHQCPCPPRPGFVFGFVQAANIRLRSHCRTAALPARLSNPDNPFMQNNNYVDASRVGDDFQLRGGLGRPREMWVSVMFVLFVAVSAAPDAHSRDVSLARRNLTNCFPFSHVRQAPENACMLLGRVSAV